jgi:hypothetical protein
MASKLYRFKFPALFLSIESENVWPSVMATFNNKAARSCFQCSVVYFFGTILMPSKIMASISPFKYNTKSDQRRLKVD